MAVAMKTYERMTVVAGTKEDPVRLPCACSKKGMSAGRTVRMLPDGAIVRGFVVSCPECGGVGEVMADEPLKKGA
jgi:hypothetical protein